MRTFSPVAVVLAAVLAASAAAAAPDEITGSGVGPIKLGMKHERLVAKGLLTDSERHKGCSRLPSAKASGWLESPYHGFAFYGGRKSNRVRSVQIGGIGVDRSAGQARGIELGDTLKSVKKAFPTAKIDHSYEDEFGTTVVKIPRSAGGRFQIGVGLSDGRVRAFGVPYLILSCEKVG